MVEMAINSTEELLRVLNELPNSFIFRGQANANWSLQSSLERIVGNKWSAEQATIFEDYSLSQFQSKFHLYDTENVQPTSKLAWLSAMQHYGVPTRLLDFTESPYVALYFALEFYNPQAGEDFSVIALDYTALMEYSIKHIASRDKEFRETRASIYSKQDTVFEMIVDRFSYDIAWVAEPKQLNARLDKQAGSFLLSGNRARKIQEIVDSIPNEMVSVIKFRVSHQLYEGVFTLLRKMNLTSRSLYGNLDGLARSIRMQMQVYSA
jgi:hypothetical protein